MDETIRGERESCFRHRNTSSLSFRSLPSSLISLSNLSQTEEGGTGEGKRCSEECSPGIRESISRVSLFKLFWRLRSRPSGIIWNGRPGMSTNISLQYEVQYIILVRTDRDPKSGCPTSRANIESTIRRGFCQWIVKRTFQPANAIANCDSPRLESERRAVALGLLEEREHFRLNFTFVPSWSLIHSILQVGRQALFRMRSVELVLTKLLNNITGWPYRASHCNAGCNTGRMYAHNNRTRADFSLA